MLVRQSLSYLVCLFACLVVDCLLLVTIVVVTTMVIMVVFVTKTNNYEKLSFADLFVLFVLHLFVNLFVGLLVGLFVSSFVS